MNHAQLAASLCVALTSLSFAPSASANPNPGSAGAIDVARYKNAPVLVLFENYIIDVVGLLPNEKLSKLQSVNLQKVFGTQASDWRGVVRETLKLSDTIDIAILDLWHNNSAVAASKGIEYAVERFAADFADEYLKEGSKVDVWTPETLAAAKQRIAAQRGKQ